MDVFKEIYKDAYDIDLNEEQFLIFNFIDENISESDFILEIMDLNENLINDFKICIKSRNAGRAIILIHPECIDPCKPPELSGPVTGPAIHAVHRYYEYCPVGSDF